MLCFILQFLYVLPRPIVAIARSEMTAIVLCPTAAQRTSDNGARVSLDQAFSASVCLRSGGAEARPVAYRRPPTDKPEADAGLRNAWLLVDGGSLERQHAGLRRKDRAFDSAQGVSNQGVYLLSAAPDKSGVLQPCVEPGRDKGRHGAVRVPITLIEALQHVLRHGGTNREVMKVPGRHALFAVEEDRNVVIQVLQDFADERAVSGDTRN